ncbi:glycosyltransferase family 2 protein [Azospirillum sp. YIM B02556]|uniref:Glycosyltransferase family 2 protein n=1 Tax=Azospirillum endophyticum TaxID=2800326 RepID=A0ABS1FBM7_9PROT|nr:glycosyltransferase family A protein [Azospirillum endophyticum]MBK1840738.1 glycosyltransferase family 2 protein [Azospirillum endophyticum]
MGLSSSKKILCFALAYLNVEVFERFISSIIPEKDKIDLVVVENGSKNSNKMREIVDRYADNFIIGHFLFRRNIYFNAMQLAIDEIMRSSHINLGNYDYFIITDGDLVPDKGWLDEIISVLSHNAEVFSCGMGVHLVNKPASLSMQKVFPIPDVDCGSYMESRMGWVFMTFTRENFYSFFSYRNKWQTLLHDQELFYYAKYRMQKKVGKIKNMKAYHLTWDYLTPEYIENKYKIIDPWQHNSYSEYVLHIPEYGSNYFFESPIVTEHSTDLKTNLREVVFENYLDEDVSVCLSDDNEFSKNSSHDMKNILITQNDTVSIHFGAIGILNFFIRTKGGRVIEGKRPVSPETDKFTIRILESGDTIAEIFDLSKAVPCGGEVATRVAFREGKGLFIHTAKTETLGGRAKISSLDLSGAIYMLVRVYLDHSKASSARFSVTVNGEGSNNTSLNWKSPPCSYPEKGRIYKIPINIIDRKSDIFLDVFLSSSEEDTSYGWFYFENIQLIYRADEMPHGDWATAHRTG